MDRASRGSATAAPATPGATPASSSVPKPLLPDGDLESESVLGLSPAAQEAGPDRRVRWSALPPDERARVVDRLMASLLPEEIEDIAARLALSGGDPHLDAKIEIRQTLRALFARSGRRAYVGADIRLFYPGRKGFTPDILVVKEADPRSRTCWMVHKEGKGPDLLLEVHHAGERRADFIKKVNKYAELGISEYFVYDIPQRMIMGFRLPSTGAASPTATEAAPAYVPIPARRHRYTSLVLGLDLTLWDGRLRFLQGEVALPNEHEQVLAAAATAAEERARAARANERAEASDRHLRQTLASSVLAILRLRGLRPSEGERQWLAACTDTARLERCFARALHIAATADLFDEDGP